MIQRTLADVLPALSHVAGQSGLRVDDSRMIGIINDVQERLLSKVENAIGSVHRLRFCQYDRLIALPSRYERVLKASIDRETAPVMSKWYEFVDYGPGQLDAGYATNVLVDRGEAPVLRQSTANPSVVRCYAYVDERVSGVRPKIRVLGYDENGLWVRTQESGAWVDGESLEINGDSDPHYTTSTKKFSRITQVIKPVTNSTVELYFYDAAATTPLLIAGRYEHWETNPSFRLYFAAAVPVDGTAQVHALCKVRHRPLLANTDNLIITSLPALKKGVRAVAAEEADDEVKAETNWELAKNILTEEAEKYYGKPAPAMEVSKVAGGFGGIADVR